jgi:hypothetical protein
MKNFHIDGYNEVRIQANPVRLQGPPRRLRGLNKLILVALRLKTADPKRLL